MPSWTLRTLGRLTMLSGLALAACATHKAPEPTDVIRNYVLDLTATFDTTGKGADGAVLPELAPLSHVVEQVQMNLSMQQTRRFDDDSTGWLIRFDRVQSQSPDDTDGVEPWPLSGRSVELRRFGDGEILDIDLIEHIIGGEQQGEIFDLVFPLLSPHPPTLKDGGSAHRTTQWPIRFTRERSWSNRSSTTWQHLGMVQMANQEAWHLSYEGTWRTDQFKTPRSPPTTTNGKGSIRGEVWISTVDISVLHHQFEWIRAFDLDFPDAPGGTTTIRQVQHFSGVLTRQ